MTIHDSPIVRMTRAYQHLERMTEVIGVLAKYGFGDLLDRLGLGDILVQARRLVGLSTLDQRLSRPVRLRLAMEELGLAFIKLGQYLSTRQDLLPREYLDELTHLQDSVPSIAFADILSIINRETDEGLLREVSPEPLAAASIGQVHSAILASGQEVVIKVRRPGLKKKTRVDLEILTTLAEQVERHLPFLKFLNPVDLVTEFSRTLTSELNFRLEASNLERFSRLYANTPGVKIPHLYKNLTTDNILVMEKIEGIKLADTSTLINLGYSLPNLARSFSKIVIEQIMQYGFFHADPHPGNILVLPGPTIGFLDFGLVGHLDRRTREELLNLALGIVRHSPVAIVRSILKLTHQDTKIDRERLEMEISIFLDTHLSGTLKDINLGLLLKNILDLLSQHQLRTPPDLLLLTKTICQFESLGLILDPNYNIIDEAGPIVSKLYKRRFSPLFWLETLNRQGQELGSLLEKLPSDLQPMYQMIKKGSFKAEISMKDMDKLSSTLHQASYRMAFAIVLASLVIGSSLVLHANLPPRWHGIPILGLFGFLGAGVVGFWLLIDFVRKKNRF